ncbi:MAG TPA: DUF2259 domain-containing protein [Bauldia sp.]|nr:DUF2259 domain-containing protein [Bauldia sp.]
MTGTGRGLAAALFLSAAPAIAGDFADRELIGFSKDGKTFAFEEYGVQDGSGFPYSNIYVIDTDSDAWVPGSPVRVRREDEAAPLAAVRAEARAKAKAILAGRRVEARGTYLVSNPITELSADPYRVRFRTNPYLASDDRTLTLTLTPLALPPSKACAPYGEAAGFRLTLANLQGGARVLHEDRAIPPSRGCAASYAISDVISLDEDGGPATIAVLVSVFMQGFEGPDRRFVAVTARFGQPFN